MIDDERTKSDVVPPGVACKDAVRMWAMFVFTWEMSPEELTRRVDSLYKSRSCSDCDTERKNICG